MKNIKVVKIEAEEVVSVTCDKCGREMVGDALELQEALCLDTIGGYGSVFGDGNRIELDLCQHCLKELLGQYCRITLT